MTLPEILSIAASLIGIIGGPLSLYFSYKASKNAGHAVAGADELAKRMSHGPLFSRSARGIVTGVEQR
jgi:hypothetical protein